MTYLIFVFLASLFSISSTQVIPSDSNYLVISTVPDNPAITTIGWLSSTGSTVYDPFDDPDVLYAISSNGTLISYSANDEGPQELGIVGTKPNVPNALLVTIPSSDAIECAPVSGTWSTVKDADGFQILQWENTDFPNANNVACFCVTNNGDVGGKVYAVFTDPPEVNCTTVTLQVGG